MSAHISAQFDEAATGRLSESELAFLGSVRDLLRAAIDGRVPFTATMANLLEDLKAIRRSDWDVGASVGPGKPSAVRRAILPDSAPARAKASPSQRELLEDFAGLIEFSVRNGISVVSLLASITHDLVELSTYGWNLDAASADCFRPNATGWAKLNQEPAGGEPDETGE